MNDVSRCGVFVCAMSLLPLVSNAATARLDDYAQGVAIQTITTLPVVQIALPDEVYRGVVTDDLSDVRVFNANGVPVSHALCAAVSAREPSISQESLAVYRLQDVPGVADEGTRIQVQTSGGTEVSVQGAGSTTHGSQTAAYVIDARAVSDELRALQFDWESPDGASEAHVSIQASDDLDQWRTVVAGSTLLNVAAGTQQLRRHRVNLPQARYQYLRVERVDRGPPLAIAGVVAERVSPAPVVEPVWMNANPLTNDSEAYTFDAGRRAPLSFARLTQLVENTSMHVAIESRSTTKAAWVTRWTGEVYLIASGVERRESPPAEFDATTDREWRVKLTQPGETFFQAPTLELGYRPARLRFLAQGPAPYTVAYGSRRAEPVAGRDCDDLLGGLKKQGCEHNGGDGIPGAVRNLGGDAALRPLAKPTPIRQLVLWGVLVLAVGALVGMALSLLRRVAEKHEGERS
jgi:hypothetical protein